jgi:hypothetical protein
MSNYHEQSRLLRDKGRRPICQHCKQRRYPHRKGCCKPCYLAHGKLYPSKKAGRKTDAERKQQAKKRHRSPYTTSHKPVRRMADRFLSAEWLAAHEARILAETARVQRELKRLAERQKLAKEGREA